jgi:hypothetical protein
LDYFTVTLVIVTGEGRDDEEERHPIVTRPAGRFTLHNHCGKSGSEFGDVLGT